MEETFTLLEIERAIAQSPKHIVHCEPSPSVDDGFRGDITTIEVDMFLFRLFKSNMEKYNEYKKLKHLP
jgi:hypothetical protein